MKSFPGLFRPTWIVGLTVIAGLTVMGCGKKEVDAADLERSIRAVVPATVSQSDPVKQVADQAVAATRDKNYEGGAVALEALRVSPSLNGDQLTAAQDAMAAYQKQLIDLADRGDANAKRALETMRTRSR